MGDDAPATAPAADVLLHTCCAPCAIGALDHLAAEGLQVEALFCNPNIHPVTEFIRRLEAFELLAERRGLVATIRAEYGLERFLAEVGSSPTAAERCRRCAALRLRETASLAAQRGIPAFSTTLLISVYQRHDEIRQLGEALALQTGVRFLYRDFRPRFREAQQAAAELGLYRQPYCGCVFSEAERYERKLRRPRPRLSAG